MFDGYAIAVKLSLVSNVGAGLQALSSQFKKVDGDAGQFSKRLKEIEQLAKGGLLMGGAGLALAGMFKTPLEDARKLQTEIAKFSLFGLSENVNNEALRFAKGMNIMGSSMTENMKLMREAQGVFRESGRSGMDALEGAKIAAPFLAKIAFATAALDGESQAKMQSSSLAMMRYIEDSGGLKSPQRFAQLADAGWKMVQTSGGSVDWEQLRQFKARAGIAGMNMSDNAIAELEPIITMLKGQTAGFSLRTAYNRLNGIIKIPNQVAHELVNNHIWDAHKIAWNSQGGIKSFKGNPLVQSELFSTNAVDFYKQVIMPLYQREGKTTDAQIAQSNAMLFGSTGGAMFTLIHKNMEKLKQSLDAQNKAMGINDSAKAASNTLAGQELQLHAQWRNLMTQLGMYVLPSTITAVTMLNGFIGHLNDFLKKNGDSVRSLTQDLFYLAPALAIGGTIKLTTAAFKGMALAADLARVRSMSGAGEVSRLAEAVGGIEKKGGIAQATKGLLGFTGALTKLSLGLLIVPDLLRAAAAAGTYVGKWVAEHQKKSEADDGKFHPGLGVMDPTLLHPNAPVKPGLNTNRSYGGYLSWTGTPWDGPDVTKSAVDVARMMDISHRQVRADAIPVPPRQVSVTVQVRNVLDGKDIASKTVETITKHANRAPTGGSFIDQSMAAMHPGSWSGAFPG